MRLLIRYGAKTNVRDQDGNTPLHMLLRHRNFQSKLDLLQLFIDHGTNVNAPNEFGSVPLHTAASIAEVEPVKILLEHGADVNRKDDHGYVPLHLASSAVGIRKELATLLLENGADPVAQTDYGQVALVETSWRGKADNEWIRAALMKYGNGNGNSKQN
ncbi:RNA polymerase II sequence-specific DNA-binding transcription factor binding [Ophidiomyces ophidiicola]|nr:RNA polymerase II sequence-specific DNA-binding transcription factor binding [Ophidiomyces ophidiicola]